MSEATQRLFCEPVILVQFIWNLRGGCGSRVPITDQKTNTDANDVALGSDECRAPQRPMYNTRPKAILCRPKERSDIRISGPLYLMNPPTEFILNQL